MPRKNLAVLAAAGAAFLIAGCGSPGGHDGPADTPSASAAAAMPPASARSAAAAECAEFNVVLASITRSTSGITSGSQLDQVMDADEPGWTSKLNSIISQDISDDGQAGNIAFDLNFIPLGLELVKQEADLGPEEYTQAEAEWTRTQADLSTVSGDCAEVN